MSSGWQVFLFGRFRLISPAGLPIELRSKRLEALVAALIISAPRGLDRQELSRILWPESDSRQGLRQALFELRRTLGTDVLETSPSWCRWSDGATFTSDFINSSLRTSSVFMPDQPGEWFERLRAELEEESPASAPSPDPFYTSLGWLARHDARAFFHLLQSTPNLARGLEFSELRELVDLAHRAEPCALGWSHYWKGTSEEDLLLCADHLNASFNHARQAEDLELASEVTLELGKVYARLNRAKAASRLCSVADDLAQKSRRSQAKANSLKLKGVVSCYFGDFELGIHWMEAAETHLSDVLGRALARTSRAYFLASIGRSEEALDLLDLVRTDTDGLHHARIANTAAITQAIATYRLRERDFGAGMLRSTLETSVRTGFTQHGVCAAELLAQIHTKESNPDLVQAHRHAAAKGRAMSKAVKTPLEWHRESLLFQ